MAVRGEIASPELAARVREMALAEGALAAARKLGVDRGTMTRVAARMPVNAGTLALLREKLRDDCGAGGAQ